MKWDTSCKVPSTVPGTTYVLNKFSSITGVICQFHSYIILHSEKVFPILSQKSVSQKLLPLPFLPSVPTEHPRFLDSNLSISFYSICAIISQSLMLWLPAYECCLICQHSQKNFVHLNTNRASVYMHMHDYNSLCIYFLLPPWTITKFTTAGIKKIYWKRL